MRHLAFVTLAARLLIVALLAVTAAGVAHAREQYPQLTSPGARVTDEAMAEDHAAFATLERRIAEMPDVAAPERVYTRALASGWLALARDQYRLNDRTGLVESAYARAGDLVVVLERGGTELSPLAVRVPGSIRMREDLWRLADSLKRSAALPCVAEPLARFELDLVRAGHEHAVCRAADPHPLRDALAARAHALREAANVCSPPVAIAEETVPEPPPLPEPETSVIPEPVAQALERLGALNNVHFDLNADTLSVASQTVLDSVASVMKTVPGITATLYGHTDPRGSADYNFKLGRRRCLAVFDYLMRAGIAGDRLAIVSKGLADPVALGVGVREHALNRRVEIQYLAPGGVTLEVRRQEKDLQLEKPRVRPAAPRKSPSKR